MGRGVSIRIPPPDHPADRERIKGLGVRTVSDLRSQTELDRDGRFDASGEVGVPSCSS
jgi:hypothetical protein